MKKILIIMGRFLPGYRDGGPVRSIVNLISHLGDEFEFSVLTTDRDHGDTSPYSNIKVNEWNKQMGIDVMYVVPGGFTDDVIIKASSGKDLILLCGCFNDYARNTLRLKQKNKLKLPIIIAAMGLFSPGALKIHYWKKKVYITICKLTGLFNNVSWVATSEEEKSDIKIAIGNDVSIDIAQDLPRNMLADTYKKRYKETGRLNVCFLSRIDPQKNLLFVIELLKKFKTQVELNIYGAVHNSEYWDKCRKELEGSNCKWKYYGEVSPDNVGEAFSESDVFLFPTKGENYGHVIVEALSTGRPVIVSDNTPWKNFDKKMIGAVISLDDVQGYENIIGKFIDMDNSLYREYCENAFRYAREIISNPKGKEQYLKLFNKYIEK